jgi:hypothetical protein
VAPRIEPATPADGGAVYDLFFPFGYASPDLDRDAYAECWRRHFFGAPHGSGCVYVARDAEGRIVAHLGAVPFPYLVHGEKRWGGFLSQLFIHPEHRRNPSLLLALERTLLGEYRNFGLDFLYGLVTIQPVLKAHLNLGFERGPDFSIYAFPLKLGKGLAAVRPGTPRTAASAVSLLSGAACRTFAALARPALEIREATGELDEDLLARSHASWGIRAERSSTVLCRRFEPVGRKRYRIFAAVEHGRDRGYIILRRAHVQGFDAMAILDVLAPEDAPQARRSLLRYACREAVREGCDCAAALERSGTLEARALRSCFFFRMPASFTLIVDRASGLAPADWYANWFDHDYI